MFQGQVPLNLLDMTLSNKAKAIYSNSMQLAAQYNKKRSDIEKNAISFLYKPYEAFDHRKYEEIIEHVKELMSREQYNKVVRN